MTPAMNLSSQIAKQFRDLFFGGNWTAVNMKETLADVTWQQSITKIHDLNSIATLVAHVHYYLVIVSKVLNGDKLSGKDSDSFNHPPVNSEEDWQQLLNKVWADAEDFARLIEQFPESRLWEIFFNEKYGSYYRNFTGIIEHTHYHLGQIVLIKKLLK